MFTRNSPIVPLALVAAIAASLVPAAAFAGTEQLPWGRTISVTAVGLDLATADGRSALDARIARAAKRVCAPDDLRDLAAMANRARCEMVAVESASGQRAALFARAETRMQMAAARAKEAGIQ